MMQWIDTIRKPSVISSLILFAVFFALPLFTQNFYYLSIFTTVFIYIIFATSWDVFAGYVHLMNFGHALFVGAAGYLTAYLDIRYGVSPFLILIACSLLCAVLGMFIGLATLRHTGPYFAMLTIAFAHVAHETSIMLSDYTGGEEGIHGISTLTQSWIGDYYFILTAMTVIFVLLLWYTRSRYGLLLKAIDQNEDAVLASGISATRIKTAAYTISGAACGIGGSLYAYSLMHVGPTSLEQVMSTTILIIAIVGGIGTIVGPFVGAIILVMLNELLRSFGDYRLLIYTVLVVFIVFFAPKGVVGCFKYLKPEAIRAVIFRKAR